MWKVRIIPTDQEEFQMSYKCPECGCDDYTLEFMVLPLTVCKKCGTKTVLRQVGSKSERMGSEDLQSLKDRSEGFVSRWETDSLINRIKRGY